MSAPSIRSMNQTIGARDLEPMPFKVRYEVREEMLRKMIGDNAFDAILEAQDDGITKGEFFKVMGVKIDQINHDKADKVIAEFRNRPTPPICNAHGKITRPTVPAGEPETQRPEGEHLARHPTSRLLPAQTRSAGIAVNGRRNQISSPPMVIRRQTEKKCQQKSKSNNSRKNAHGGKASPRPRTAIRSNGWTGQVLNT